MTDIDAELPKAAIKRIIKSKLAGEVPEGSTKRDVQVNKEALAAFTQATKVFISYVASAAHDICSENKRSTVVPKDVLQALGDLNFGGFIPQLEEMLQEMQNKRKASRSDADSEAQSAKEARMDLGEDVPGSAM